MTRNFRSFLGVDLGGGKGKNTAVARLELGPEGVDAPPLVVAEVGTTRGNTEIWYDEALVAYLGARAGDAVLAIDAPLTLTACLRCRRATCPGTQLCPDPTLVWFRTAGADLIAACQPPEHQRIVSIPSRPAKRGPRKPATTPYTQRAAEVLLHRRHGIIPRETLGQGMGPLTARAAHLVRALAGHGYQLHRNLIEVYPKATLHKLFGPAIARRYKREVGTWETRAEVLETLRGTLGFAPTSGLARESCLENDHCFDAVICAYTAYLWAREGWTLPADHREVFREDGWIYVPGV